MKLKWKVIVAGILLTVQSEADIKPFIQVGAEIPVVKNPTKTIEVDGGYAFEAGLEYSDPQIKHYSTQFLLGYQKDFLTQKLKKKDDVSIDETRKYVSIIEKYTVDNVHFGLGLSYHISPKVDYTYNNHITHTFDDALGYTALWGFSITDHMDISLKGTYVKYKIAVKRKNKIYKREYNTSYLNIFLSYKF